MFLLIELFITLLILRICFLKHSLQMAKWDLQDYEELKDRYKMTNNNYLNLITRHTKLPNRLVARSIADVKEELDNLTGRVVDVEEAKRRNQLISVLDWLEEINND